MARLVQVRGYNAFSYADVAAELHLTKAALHYHFAGKAELGEALIARYAARFADALASAESRFKDAPSRLDAYAGGHVLHGASSFAIGRRTRALMVRSAVPWW